MFRHINCSKELKCPTVHFAFNAVYMFSLKWKYPSLSGLWTLDTIKIYGATKAAPQFVHCFSSISSPLIPLLISFQSRGREERKKIAGPSWEHQTEKNRSAQRAVYLFSSDTHIQRHTCTGECLYRLAVGASEWESFTSWFLSTRG